MGTGGALLQATVRRLLQVVTLLTIAVLLIPARAAAVDFGVQFHGTWSDYTAQERSEVLDTLSANGADTVRIDVSWAMLQPHGPGPFDPWGAAQVDAAITGAADRGLKPLVTLWLAPRWATGSSDDRVAPSTPRALRAWREFTRQIAQRYSGVVAAWEVWNEPNSGDFMRGASPRTYAQVLRFAYAGLKQGSPRTPVVFGGTMYVDVAWIARVFAAGGTTYDVMSVHPYQGVADEAPEARDNGSMYRLTAVSRLRQLMVRSGHSQRKIWFTEFGWRVGTSGAGTANWKKTVTARQQAAYLVRTLELVQKKYPYVTHAYWYKDRADSGRNSRTGYGLVKPDGSPTRALTAARSYLR